MVQLKASRWTKKIIQNELQLKIITCLLSAGSMLRKVLMDAGMERRRGEDC